MSLEGSCLLSEFANSRASLQGMLASLGSVKPTVRGVRTKARAVLRVTWPWDAQVLPFIFQPGVLTFGNA